MYVDYVYISAGALRVQRRASYSPRAGVTGNYKVSGMDAGNLGLLQEQHILLITELSFQPL